ncbi:toprim domain-containing protein, partial [Porphyromonas levii]
MIDKEQILTLTQGGLNVYNHYLGFEVNTHKNFRSPFYDDKKPSCHIYYDAKSTSYKFHDHGEPSYSGDCFWFVGELYGLDTRRDFLDILKLIVQDLMLPIRVTDDYPSRFDKRHIQRKWVRPKAIQEEERIDNKPYKIQTISYSQPFLTFWGRYGVDENTLKRYNVINISQFESINSQGEAYTIKATGTEPIYGYKGYDYVKIYRPNSTKLRFLYGGRKPSLYCFGLDQLPTKGDVLLITGGEKDVLSLAAHGFNAICFNSETSVIPESLIDGLSLRFRHIVLLYDVDETGIRESERQKVALEKYKVRSIQLPLSGGQFEKDVSDFFSLGHTSEELRGLLATLLQEIYSETLMMMKSCEIDYANPPDL